MNDQAIPAGWGGTTSTDHGNGEQIAFNGATVALMLMAGKGGVPEIRERLGVSRATAYRYIRAARAALAEAGHA
jgi:hypothetical protein